MIPWWRVVAKNGRITSPDAILQEELLRSEGVPMQAAGLVQINDAFWLPVLD
jgi:alkylated DNA nucleotide flippase Atl1